MLEAASLLSVLAEAFLFPCWTVLSPGGQARGRSGSAFLESLRGAPSTGLSPLSQLPQAHTDPRKDADLAEKAGAGRLSGLTQGYTAGLAWRYLAPGSSSSFQAVSLADRSPERNLGGAWLPPHVARAGAWLCPEPRGKQRPAEASFWPTDPSCSVEEHSECVMVILG